MTHFTLDSNILVYAADGRDPVRRFAAIDIIESAAALNCVLLPQALAEFFHVVVRKRILPQAAAAAQVEDWMALFTVVGGPGAAALRTAIDAALAGRFQLFDALFLATAAEAGCTAAISEDMADGADLNGVRVVGAFDQAGNVSPAAHALLHPDIATGAR